MEESDLLLGECAPPPKIYLSPEVQCSNMQRKIHLDGNPVVKI